LLLVAQLVLLLGHPKNRKPLTEKQHQEEKAKREAAEKKKRQADAKKARDDRNRGNAVL
jgi:hypothetical protein